MVHVGNFLQTPFGTQHLTPTNVHQIPQQKAEIELILDLSIGKTQHG